jgi:hypothetical protein
VVTAAYPAHIPVYDGVDWYWGRSLSRALRHLDQQTAHVVVLEWWSGAVLHTYLRLARYAARTGARVILEWHEGQDIGEAEVPGARRYVQSLMPRLLSGWTFMLSTPTLICSRSRQPSHWATHQCG